MEYQRSENGESRDNLQFLIREKLIKCYIIDASVCIKWFSISDEKDLDKSNALRDYYYQGKIFLVAPDLILYEISNALSFNPEFDNESVQKAIQSLYQMEIGFIKPDRAVMLESIKLRFEKDITVYDSAYLALAKLYNLQFITADQKLHNRIKDIGYTILLSDLVL